MLSAAGAGDHRRCGDRSPRRLDAGEDYPGRSMRLLPHEQDRLLLFLAAELARARRARGLELNQAEATALIADAVCEAARDGCSYAEAERRGYEVLQPGDVLDGVEALVARIEVEALFADGMRLVVLHAPVLRDAPPAPADPPVRWLDGGLELAVLNTSQTPIAVTSHFHFFEANPRLEFDRAAAYGRRLAVEAGVKVFFAPGEPRTVFLLPIGGARIVRGHGGLVDGPLDAAGAREAALARARERGYRGSR
jgi:urease subunit gamma/beta